MKLGRVEINARMIDHHLPPRWIGPWLGVRIKPKPEARRAGQLFDVHAQLHMVPDEQANGVQAGLVVALYRGDRYLVRFGRNWWSRRYGQRPQGWGWWVDQRPSV
jgi:hypothetical protein